MASTNNVAVKITRILAEVNIAGMMVGLNDRKVIPAIMAENRDIPTYLFLDKRNHHFGQPSHSDRPKLQAQTPQWIELASTKGH